MHLVFLLCVCERVFIVIRVPKMLNIDQKYSLLTLSELRKLGG